MSGIIKKKKSVLPLLDEERVDGGKTKNNKWTIQSGVCLMC